MKANLKYIILCLTLFIATDVSAKYFVEPHGAFIISGSSDAPDTPDAPSYSGPSFGAKLGYYQKEFGFNYGLDFTHSSYTYATRDTASATYSRNDIGLFLGYNSQNKYRLWGGVYYAKLTLSGSDYYNGHGFEIGFGYAVAPKVSLNIYYKLPTYTNSNMGGNSQKLNPAQSDSEIAVGVSFPLEM